MNVKLVSRTEALTAHAVLGQFIVNIQELYYTPTPFEPCKMYVEDEENSRWVSQAECDAWNKEELYIYNQKKDKIPAAAERKNSTGILIYSINGQSIEEYVGNLTVAICSLCKQMGWRQVTFILEYPVPWLSQENDYTPAKNATDYLKSIGIESAFEGAIQIQQHEEIAKFIGHLFWLSRCNASLPTCRFSGDKADVIFFICKDGNLHLETFSESTKQQIISLALKIDLLAVEDCFPSFSEVDLIEGRQIIV
jgi:hypothetical protein